jgi:hypothetical protein
MNSITSKLRVRPSYLMRGEEVIWGENYASRYIVSTNHRTAQHCTQAAAAAAASSSSWFLGCSRKYLLRVCDRRYTDWLEESRVSGCLLITNYQLIFVPDSAAQVRVSRHPT